MTFMANLAANPSGSSIYGQPSANDDMESLGIVNKIKDREMKDFQDKANFMADLSIKQDRMKRLFDTQGPFNQPNPGQNGQQQGQPNVVMGKDPNTMTGYEKGELGVRQQGLNLESQKLGQQNKLGEQALGIKADQEKLNQQKSDQINDTKQKDMQRKIDDANNKLGLAYDQLNNKANSLDQTLAAHKAVADAMEERHKLELAQKDAQFQKTSQQHQQTIDNLTEQLKQRGKSQTTTEVNADGTKKTSTTLKGSAADTVNVVGKDGKTYTIPKDKLDDWNANHKPDSDQSDNNDEGEE